MQIPDRIKIGPYWYDVEYPHRFEDHENCRGRIKYNQNIIQLDPYEDNDRSVSCPERVWQTLFHEITHAVMDISQVELTEKEIDMVATFLFGVMTDNDWLTPEADFVTEKEEPDELDEDALKSVIKFLKHHKNIDIEGMTP